MGTDICPLPCLYVRRPSFSRKDVRRTMNNKMPKSPRPRAGTPRRAFRWKAGMAVLMAAMILPTAAWADFSPADLAASGTLVQTAPDAATPESALPESPLVPEATPAPETTPAPEPATPETAVPQDTPSTQALQAAPAIEALSDEIPLDESQFPDPVFLAFVRGYDTDGSGGLSPTECAAVTRMDIRGKGIQSLEGIQHFPQLTYLNCIGNQLTQLPLEGMSQLTSLLCNENKITALDLSQVPELTVLHCHNNRLASLDVSHLPHLYELACGDNPFSTLDLSQNQELAYLLYMGGPLKTLTLSRNDALIDLWCSYSLVSELDLSQTPNLELLGVDRSDLTYLDLSHTPKLTSVMADDNMLLALEPGSGSPEITLGSQRPVDVELTVGETTFDLATLDVPLDLSCISDVTGAQLSGSVLTGLQDGSTVSYRYTKGRVSFTASLLFHVGNTWLEPLFLEDWTYGEEAHQPHADAQYGEPVYGDSASPEGPFTAEPPTDAGTWYVQAVVEPVDGHAGLTSVSEFHILKAQPEFTVPTGLTATYGDTLMDVKPGEGFFWKDPGLTVGSVGLRTFQARYVPADTDNYLVVDPVEISLRVLPKSADALWVSEVNNAQDAANLTVRDGDTLLKEGVDYTVTSRQENGRVELTITFQGNYTGQVLRGYAVTATSAPEKTPTPTAASTNATEEDEESSAPSPAPVLPATSPTAAPAFTPAPTPAPTKAPETTPEPDGLPTQPPTPAPTATPAPSQTGETAETADGSGPEDTPTTRDLLLLVLLFLLLLFLLAVLLSALGGDEDTTDDGDDDSQDSDHDLFDNDPFNPDHR